MIGKPQGLQDFTLFGWQMALVVGPMMQYAIPSKRKKKEYNYNTKVQFFEVGRFKTSSAP